MANALKAAVWNCAILVVGAIPIGIFMAWVEGLISPAEWRHGMAAVSGSGALSTFPFWWLVLVVPVLIGGCFHQIVLRFVPMPRDAAMWRLVVVFTTPVVLLGFLLIGNSPNGLIVPRAIVPVVVSLFVYGMLAHRLTE